MTAETQIILPQGGTGEIKNKGSGQKISNDVRIALIVVGALGAVLVVVGATTFALNAINNNYALAMIMTGTAFVSFGVGAIIALVRDHLNKKKKSELEQPEINENTQSTPGENQETLEKLRQDLNRATLREGELNAVINRQLDTITKLQDEHSQLKYELDRALERDEYLKKQFNEEQVRCKAAETNSEGYKDAMKMQSQEKQRITNLLEENRLQLNKSIQDGMEKDKKILQLEASNQGLTIKLQAYVDKQSELREKLRQAVICGNIDSTREILDTASTKEALLALLVSKAHMLRIAASDCDNPTNQQEIIKLILSYAAKFDALTDVLYLSDRDSPNAKYCALVPDQTAACVCVLQFLEAYPGPLKQLLKWEQPFNRKSLFQLAIKADSDHLEASNDFVDSKKNRDGVTASILHAADTVGMCMSIVTDAKHGISSSFCEDTEIEPHVIRCIMEAVKTPENQLAVIKLTKDEDGEICFGTGHSVAQTLTYELFCLIRMKSDINRIQHILQHFILDYFKEEFAGSGVVEKALEIATECNNEQAADALRKCITQFS